MKEMNTPIKIILFSLGCWLILTFSILILSVFNIADPFFTLEEFFSRFGSSGTYSFPAFGLVFSLWSISSFLAVFGLNLITAPLSLGSLFPIIILFTITVSVGYFVGLRKGIPITILLLMWGTLFGLLLSLIVPYTLPTTGLSSEDQDNVLNLGGNLFKLTYLIPLNLIFELIITIGLCIGGLGIGFISQKIVTSRTKEAVES